MANKRIRTGDQGMLSWLKSIDWGSLLGSALVLLFLLSVLPSSENRPTYNRPPGQQSESYYQAIGTGTLSSVGDWIHAWREEITAVSTGVIALFTITLFFAAYLQYRTLRDDTRILQRAYITVAPLGTAPFVSGAASVSCDVGIRNVGHLPASDVRWWFGTKFSADRDERVPPPHDPTDGPLVIAPGVVVIKGIGPALSKADFATFRDSSKIEDRWLYMWGRVEYRDGFGKKRFTEFCHRYNLHAAGGAFCVAPEHARYHQHGNRTDESE